MSAFSSAPAPRIRTGVPGLDWVLHGGFLAHGVYLLIGQSGTGKSTLANQIAFNQAATAPVCYVTVLAETHTRLLGQMSQFAFFDRSLIGSGLSYLSAYEAFQEDSYPGLGRFLVPLIRSTTPQLLVVDGLPLTTPGSVYDPSLMALMHELQVASEFGGCTTLIVSPAHRGVWESRALMVVDGALEVTRQLTANTLEWFIQVQIFRGGSHQPGIYPLTMDTRGIVVQPPPPPPSTGAPADSAPPVAG